jgi:hypothetical protein
MYAGTVVAIIDDFLGKSIVLEYRLSDHRSPLLTIYGHVAAREALQAGSVVRESEIIGTLVGPGTSFVHIYPHLHVSLAWPSERASYENLTWRHLSDPELFTMIDPLSVIGGPYRLIERVEEIPEPT